MRVTDDIINQMRASVNISAGAKNPVFSIQAGSVFSLFSQEGLVRRLSIYCSPLVIDLFQKNDLAAVKKVSPELFFSETFQLILATHSVRNSVSLLEGLLSIQNPVLGADGYIHSEDNILNGRVKITYLRYDTNIAYDLL